VERSKSRAILEQLGNTELRLAGKGIPRRIYREEQTIREKRRAQENLLRTMPVEHPAYQDHLQELSRLEVEWNQLLKRLEHRAPEWVSLRRGNPIAFSEVARLLKP
jgi:superfamily I DNA and/or RNA helicase